MKIQIHFFTALVGSVAIYFVTSGNLLASSLFFTSSFLIDADHALDYVLIYKRIDVLRMLKGHFYKDRIYVFLHSAEIPIIALLVWPGMYSAVFAAG